MNRPRSLVALALIALWSLAACSSHRFASSGAERPGLGTTWGETRQSRVRSAAFERAEPQAPVAVAVVHYDDHAGLQAMTAGGAVSLGGDEIETAGGLLQVRLLDARGRALPLVRQGARQYVEGSDGERYTIEVENRSGGRFEVVATVDGLDVLDGERGSFAKRGYLLDPWATLRIEGFRRSLDEVAAFRFGSVSGSYAAQKGDDTDVGVIGVAFFGERGWAPPPWPDADAVRRRAANPFPARFAAPPGSSGW